MHCNQQKSSIKKQKGFINCIENTQQNYHKNKAFFFKINFLNMQSFHCNKRILFLVLKTYHRIMQMIEKLFISLSN